MKGTDKHEILEAIGSLAEQTRELKQGRTEILDAIGSLTEDTRELKEGRVEILEAIQSFATAVDERFDRHEGRTSKIEGHFTKIEGQLIKIEGRTAKIEATMVTKDYLDDKLADFYSDIVNFVKRRVPSWREAV